MGKKAKKKARAPPREKRAATPSKNVSEQPTLGEETVEDAVEAAKKKLSCVHFDKGVKLDKVLEKIKSSGHIKCGECKEGVHERRGSKGKGNKGKKGVSSSDPKSDNKAIWVCLECGYYSCGGVGLPTGAQSHVVRHIRLTRHRLVMQWENPQLRWCFPCHSLLPVENEENGEKKDVLMDVVKLIKERPMNTSGGADTEGLCSENGSVTSEIKSEGAVSSGVEARDGYVVRGLVNLGNTCFFNSVMQNLLSLDQLRQHFLNEDTSGGGGPLISSLKKLFAETKPEAGLKSVINPRAFFGSVCSKSPQFRGYQQHDSHELLRCLLDGLSTEESSLRKKLGASGTSGESTHMKRTLIDTVFGGEISSTVSCTECGHSSKVCEPFLDLSLPVPTKKPSPKKQQTVSRAKKTKLPPKRVPKTRSKGNKNPESVPANAASENLDCNSTGKGKIVADDSSASSSSGPASTSIENGPVLETHSGITLENRQASETATKTDSVFDSFWLDFLEPESTQDEMGLDLQDNGKDSLQKIEANGSVPGSETPIDSSSDRTFEGGGVKAQTAQDEDEQATESIENTFVSEMPTEIDQTCHVGGDSGLTQNSSVNPWEDEELPLLVSDSQVLYMPYKEESSCTDKTIAEAEASSSFVSGGEEQDINFVGIGCLFDEPDTSEGPVYGPPSKAEVSEVGFMAVSSESDLEEIDDSDSPVSVERCLAYFTKPEMLSDDNAWHCENCSRILKLQRLREKKKANASRLRNLENGEIIENSANSVSHDKENNSSDLSCVNAENGNRTSGSTELSGASCGIQDHDSSENSLVGREVVNSQSTDGSESGRSEDDEAVDSEKVIVKRDATKRVLINKVPPILTVHLKRFSQDTRGRLSKLSGHVAFKEFIHLQPYMDSRCNGEEKPVYRLAGVVEHSGTMRGGHYVAYVRGGQKTKRDSAKETNSVWYHVSDSYVRQVSLEEVLRSEAYILFYERI